MGKRTVVRLGDVCNIVSGTTPSSTKPEYWDGGLPWVTPAEISDDSHIITDTQRTLTEAGVLSKKLPLLPKGTVLLSSRAPIGKVAIAGCDMYCNQGFKNLICSDAIFNEYLYCFLKSQNERLQHMGHGATFKELSKKILSDMMIPVPPLDMQREIVSTLEAVSRLTAIAEQMLAKADELIQSRFVEMFDSQPTCALLDFCDFYSGGTPSKKNPEYWDGSLPWFSPKDIKRPMLWDSIDHVNDEITEKTNLKLIPEDTVVVVVRGMILAHDVPVAIVKTAATINQDLKAMIPKRECNAVFLASALRNQEKMLLAETGQSAHGTKKLDTDVLGSVAVPNVPLALQNEFAEFVTQVESLKATARRQLDRLNTLYDSLAQRYFAE